MNDKIDVMYNPAMLAYQIYVSRKGYNERVFITDGGKTQITVANDKPIESDKLVFAVLEYDLAEQLLQQLSDKGIKSGNDSKNEGLLEATKYHLEDMRTLLKIKKERE